MRKGINNTKLNLKKFRVFCEPIPKYQLYYTILLQRPWWQQTNNELETNFFVSKDKHDIQKYKNFAGDKCVFNHLPSNELITNYWKLYSQLKLQNQKLLFTMFRVTYNLSKELDKFLNHIHYLECQILGMDANEYNYIQELYKHYPDLQYNDAETNKSQIKIQKYNKENHYPGNYTYTKQQKNVPMPVQLSIQQEKRNDQIWGVISKNLELQKSQQLKQLQQQNNIYLSTYSITTTPKSNFKHDKQQLTQYQQLNSSVKLMQRPQSVQTYSTSNKQQNGQSINQQSIKMSRPRSAVVQHSKPNINLNIQQTKQKQEQLYQNNPFIQGIKAELLNIMDEQKICIFNKVQEKQVEKPKYDSHLLDIEDIKKLFASTKQKYVPDEYAQTPLITNTKNMWSIYNNSDQQIHQVNRVWDFVNLVHQNKLLSNHGIYCVKDSERCALFQNKKIYFKIYSIIKANGDVYIYKKPMIQLEQKQQDYFERQLINQLQSYYDDKNYITLQQYNKFMDECFSLKIPDIYSYKIEPKLKSYVKQLILTCKSQLTKQASCANSFEFLEFTFLQLDQPMQFNCVLQSIVSFPEVTVDNSFTICFYPYLIDDMFDITVDQTFYDQNYLQTNQLKIDMFQNNVNRQLFIEKERLVKIERTIEYAQRQKRDLLRKELIFEDEEVMADVPLKDRRIDGLRFNGGRHLNQFNQILKKWQE